MDKKNIYTEYFYNQYSNNTDYKKYYLITCKQINRTVWDIFKYYNKKVKILDLWCWFWWFANYCKLNWFSNYTWVDLSKDELSIAKKNFPNYKFIYDDIFESLKSDQNNYDIIYMSMVFEHFELNQCPILIKEIYKKLNKNWVFINYQPNADSYFNSCSTLYIDITHERLWNRDSYLQLIKTLKLENYKINFRNSYIWWNVFWNLLHKSIKKLFELFLLLMWYNKKYIYTKSFYSILYKK